MAKSKKSKILAMALCASVMTGIYASPVMAITVDDKTQNITSDTKAEETYFDGKVIADKFGTPNGAFYVDINGTIKGDFLIIGENADNDVFKVDRDGAVKAANGAFTVDKNGNVRTTTGDVVAAGTYSLKNIGERTAGITQYKDDTTYFKGAVNVEGSIYSKDGKFVIGEDSATYLAERELKLGAADGQTLTAEKLSTINSVIADNGEVVSQSDVTSTYIKEDGTKGYYHLNEVGADLEALETNVGNISGNVAGIKRNDPNLPYGKGKTEIEGVVGVNGKNGRFYVLGEDGITQAAVITNDGTARFGDYNNANVRMENGVLSINSEGTKAVASLSKDGLMLNDSVNGQQTLTAAKIADIQHIEHVDNATVIEQNTAISADGIVVKDPVSGVSTKTKYDGFYVKDKDSKIVSSLEDDGLKLTDAQSGRQTLKATDIADIKGIDRVDTNNDGTLDTTVIEKTLAVSETGIAMSKGDMQLAVNEAGFAAVKGDNAINLNESGVKLSAGNDNFVSVTQNGIGLQGGTSQVIMNSNNGAVFRNGDKAVNGETVINGGTITTGTLKVENIVLGNSMTDEVGNSIALGADGTLKVNNENYSLNLDKTRFNLSNASNTSSFSLGEFGFTFSGPVNLGAGDKVGFTHTGSGKYITLDGLVDRVEDLEQKTTGISFDENTGNTTIKDMNKGTDGKWTAGDSSVTVGDNGTTFENGEDNGTTNINGGAIYADSSSIGSGSGGSGSGSSGSGSSGTYTDGSQHSGHFEEGNNIYEFINDADGFTGTVTDGKNTTTIKNGAMGSNTTVEGDNASASSGVGIGNDGAFISDSVTNGDISHTVNGGDITNTVTDGSITDTVTNGYMTVTEVKDENGSATTVNDANNANVSSTVSQDTNGQTVSTGTGTSVNTGKDFSVTDNETGKSIYMSDIGHVEDIDSEIQNSDGSKTTVVDAVNNEAEIRRNEIERVDGRINNLENRVGKLEDRVDKVGAMSAAIANLRTMGYDPAAPTEIAVGVGQYRSETGVALGMFHYPNRDFMLSLSVSTSGDEVMGGIGATWKFGRKSPEKVAEIKKAQAEADARRAEEAKLAKAEEMKQAAKEAKIKAQQERHAKLAAQAEAAK